MSALIQEMPSEFAPASEESRRQAQLLQLFLITHASIVLVGAIRKWLFPSVLALYFLQDLPILAAYIYAVRFRLYTRGIVTLSVTVIAFLLLIQSMIQLAVLGLPLKVFVVGYHAYLFYLPMLAIFPLAMNARGRDRFMRWYILSGIPMAVLVLIQSRSSASAFVNRTTGGRGFGGLQGDLARATGTFNFVTFYGLWLTICFTFCASEWLFPKAYRSVKNRVLLLSSTAGCLISIAVSGSRGAVAAGVIVLLGVAAASFLLKNYRALMILGLFLLSAPITLGVAALVSPKMLVAFENRITNPVNVREAKGRIVIMLTDFIPTSDDLVGAGLGFGVDGSHAGELGSYEFTYQLSESDLSRILLELGVVTGSFYVAWRLLFCLGLILISVKLTVDHITPHALPLSFFLFSQALGGDWTRNPTMSTTQAFLAMSFILGAFYFRDHMISDPTPEIHFAPRHA